MKGVVIGIGRRKQDMKNMVKKFLTVAFIIGLFIGLSRTRQDKTIYVRPR